MGRARTVSLGPEMDGELGSKEPLRARPGRLGGGAAFAGGTGSEAGDQGNALAVSLEFIDLIRPPHGTTGHV